ncbi:bifunctional hydroxymethylpyrimidine kinase/phosphomethylpyrimidine kinase [Hahella ganghwensis]|uniref:bifunctional hydroxymethylpyrimidine kinase/phosphomethylpyrimidine kinase n=1 Tax=Hahella ganghwensis TaxID=286420 RepID=UPI0003668DD0|nr:hydroxymethylpyrimidine/phosphomethylpyrimidine kinase [Hahella ganghwensis]
MPTPQKTDKTPPVILTIGGLDPSGGAGIHADVKTINHLGGHGASIVTTLTVQDSLQVYGQHPVSPDILQSQLSTLLRDCQPQAVKCGALGNSEITDWLGNVFRGLPKEVFKVVDPVLSAGGGGSLSENSQIKTLKQKVLPLTDLLMPNTQELALLTGADDEEEAIRQLLDIGVNHVLVTGGHESGTDIRNRLYSSQADTSDSSQPEISSSNKEPLDCHEWHLPRIGGEYHGTGCTLASAVATLIARGYTLQQSIEDSQAWITNRIRSAYQIGRGQTYLNFLES